MNREDARKREKYLKSGPGKRYLRNRLKRSRFLTGFTLVEMVAVVAVFALVVVITADLFITITKVAKSTNMTRKVYQDARYALEAISQEARMAKSLNIDEVNNIVITTSGDNVQMEFKLSSGIVTMTNLQDGVSRNLTSEDATNVVVFEVVDTAFSNGASNIQPFFKLTIEAESKEPGSEGDNPKTRLETLISKRNYFSISTDAEKAVGGPYTTFVISRDGSLWGVGVNWAGSFGLGSNDPNSYQSWTVIPQDKITNVVDITAGFYTLDFSLAVKSDGTVWVAGQNSLSQLGLGSSEEGNNILSWAQAKTDSSTYLTDISKIYTGWGHSLAIKSNGDVWGAGNNGSAQLGLSCSAESVRCQPSASRWAYWNPSPINNVIFAAVGEDYSLAVKSNYELWATGKCTDGKVGIGDANCPSPPNYLSTWTDTGLTGVKNVSVRMYHSMVLKNDGTVWATGRNDYGQLGVGDTAIKKIWTKGIIESGGDLTNIEAISTGSLHSVALASDGTVWVTGDNSLGQLGLGNNDNKNSWVQVPTSNLSDVVAIGTGWGYSLAIKSDGTLWVTGLNGDYQLGLGNNTNVNTWTRSRILSF